MAEGAEGGSGSPTGVKPGALSALLQEIAATPEQREADPLPLVPGTVIGRFEIIRELGRGGFGVVYEARDRDLGRQVALKIVRPGRSTVEESNVPREAEAISRLAHPNLVTLFDVGHSDSGPYLVFELLRGKTLQERIDDGPLPVQEAVHIAVEVARGLAHAHAEGVVHRDLKPSNVFVTNRGQVKVLDFGMAHAFGRRRVSGGTPAYMAPEQWEDDPEDERTDVFALGVMLFQMLSGEYPFPEGDGRWSAGSATAPKLEVPGAPGLADLLDRMLDRTPKGRPRDGAAVRAALTPIEDALRTKPPDGLPAAHATRRKATLGELIAELRRRRVFRAVLGYGLFAFAILQVAEPVLHGLHLPDWVLTVVVVVLGAGLPLTILLSWAYDLKATGITRADRAAEPEGRALRRSPWLLGGLVTTGAVVGAMLSWLALRHTVPTAPLAGPDGRIVVAVADFANETGERELDALSGLLITSLEQSRRLSVLPRGRLLDLAREQGHRNVTRIDEVIGRDVVRAAGATALLAAAVHRFGGLYAVELRALDPKTDAYLFTLKEQAMGKEAIPELIDRIADRARRAFREEDADLAATHTITARAVAGSLDAYQHVFKGLQLYFEDGEPDQAIAAMNRALRIDPELAIAHLWLAVMGDFDDAPGEDAEEHLAAAVAAAPRLPERERGLVAAWQAYHDGHEAQARELFSRLVENHPLDKEVVLLAAMSAFHGSYRQESEALWVKALELDPGFSLAVSRLSDLLAMQGRTAEGVARARAAVAAKPNLPNQLQLAIALGQAGDLEGALDTARRAQPAGALPNFGVTTVTALAQAALGRFAEAEASVRPWTKDDSPDRRSALRLMADLMAMQGRRAEALAALRHMQEVPPGIHLDWKTEVQFLGVGGRTDAVREYLLGRRVRDPSWAGTFAYFGLGERAAELAKGLVPGSAAERAYRANTAWRAGRPAERLAFLREQLAAMPNVPAAFWLGEALAASGNFAEAVAEFQRVERLFVSRFTVPWRPSFWAESIVRRARSLAELGRTADAAAALDRFLAIWKRADADLPLLAEARQLRGRLQERERANQ